MDPRYSYPSNMQISTPSLVRTLQLTGGTLDFPNSARIMYRLNQTFMMILVPLLLGSSYAVNTGALAPLNLICVEIPQILELSHSA